MACEEADRHRGGYARNGPAGVLRHRPQKNRQREHCADRDTAQKAARRNDHPAIGMVRGAFQDVVAPSTPFGIVGAI